MRRIRVGCDLFVAAYVDRVGSLTDHFYYYCWYCCHCQHHCYYCLRVHVEKKRRSYLSRHIEGDGVALTRLCYPCAIQI